MTLDSSWNLTTIEGTRFFTEAWLWEASGIYVCNKSKVPIIESNEIISDTSEIRKNHKYQRNKNYTNSSSTSYRYNNIYI